MDALIAMLPHIESNARDNYMRKLELAATDPSDMLKPSVSDNDAEAEEAKLKKALGQK